MAKWLIEGSVIVFLLVCASMDVRQRKVWVPLALVMGAVGILWHIVLPGRFIMESVWGILVGLGLYGIAKVSRSAIGEGDALVLGACGTWLGLVKTVELLFGALVLAGIWAIILLVRGKGKNARFPFLPFMLAAQCLLCVWPI